MKDKSLLAKARTEEAMGHLGKITGMKDLPNEKKLLAWLMDAVKLNEVNMKLPVQQKQDNGTFIIHLEFKKGLRKYPEAGKNFHSMSDSHKKEYTNWINEARRDETRKKRIDLAIEWLLQGKNMNWKYR